MKSKKIFFAFVFLLQIHGASAGQSGKKIDIKEDSEEKKEGLDQQVPKPKKETTLDDLLSSSESAGETPNAQKSDLSAQKKSQDHADSSPSQRNSYGSYGEDGEDEVSVPSGSQSGGGRGRGEAEKGESIPSVKAEKSDHNVEIAIKPLELEAESSESQEGSYKPSEKEDGSESVKRVLGKRQPRQ